jgi:hypothetical protein
MKDARKTKGQLVNELVEMRQRIAELEAVESQEGQGSTFTVILPVKEAMS